MTPPQDPNNSETTENYLKRILYLSSITGHARISEIAELMGRSLSSVSEYIKRMSHDGLVCYEKYGKVTLSDKGKIIAEKINKNYIIFSELLQLLGLPEVMAVTDACSMEHSISIDTTRVISQFVEFIKEDTQAKECIEKFKARSKLIIEES